MACSSRNADPAAQACGTFAPRYWTGKLVLSVWMPAYSSGSWLPWKWLAAPLMSRAIRAASAAKP